ncbi:MAG: ComEC/Rec2 family competence protein [Pleurocapsa sp.]
MTRNSWIILCLAYIIGLLSTNLFTISNLSLTPQQLCIAIAFVSGLALICGVLLKTRKISSKVWLSAAIVGILAIFYFQLRIPQPGIDDISYQVEVEPQGQAIVTVKGKVITEPRLNASHKIKFWLKAEEIEDRQKVSGKLYVSLPLLQGTGVNLGETITLQGILYVPQNAVVTGGFDFRSYLARQGIFAGMQGLEIVSNYDSEPVWGWWKLRRRIVRSNLRGLGSPAGQLVSSMVLGRKAVDLPADIRDRFVEAGLAHVLAASGFHVSLLLGLILKLTNRFTAKTQLTVGICSLIIYLGLTGVQASVSRACLMGSAVLVAMVLETKVKPLGSLLLAAAIILIFNPLLINDLGFQLSFLATFGLIETMPELQSALDWLPPTVATLIAVPLAASIWVLPLLCYEFNVVATYSIVVNILCTPLIMLISLGGMLGGVISLILPIAGSFIAWLLLYPTLLLIGAINFFTNLPGSSWAIGQISLSVLLIIYSLLLSIWLNRQWRKNWRLILMFIFTLIILPIGYQHFNLTQIAVLPVQPEPVIIIQDRGKVVLVNRGNYHSFKYTVLPFLAQQGINHLDYYINLDRQFSSDFVNISDRIPIKTVISQLQNTPENKQNLDSVIKTDSFQIYCDRQLPLLQLETTKETWLILGKAKLNSTEIQQYIEQNNLTKKPLTLVSPVLQLDWMLLNPDNILSFSPQKKIIRQNTNISNSNFYNLKEKGAVIWTPQNGLKSTFNKLSFNSIF